MLDSVWDSFHIEMCAKFTVLIKSRNLHCILVFVSYFVKCFNLKVLGTETNNSDCDINLKILLISHLCTKRLKKKIEWTLYNIYIFLENSNRVFSTELSSLRHVCTIGLFTIEYSIEIGRIKCKKLFIVCCNLLLNDMKNEVLVEQFASLYHWHMASHIRLLNSGKNQMQQQRQDKHAAVTASNYNGTNYIILPVESLQTLLLWYIFDAINTVLKSSFLFAQTCTTG